MRPTTLSLLLVAALAAAGVVASRPAYADPAPFAEASPEQLVAQERARAAVEAALEGYGAPAENGDVLLDRVIRSAEGLAAIGSDVVYYLANELDQDRRDSFDFSAYALGLIRTTESETALRRAVERAEATPGQRAVQRKSWAIWALSLHGNVDALRLLTQGKADAALIPIHSNVTTFEATALQTSPQSVPVLLDMLAGHAGKAEATREVISVLRALRLVGDPAAVPAVIALLNNGDPDVRGEAVWTLGGLATPEAVDALYRTLGEADVAQRRRAAPALEAAATGVRPAAIMECLKIETETITRGFLYRVLADAPQQPCAAGLCQFAGQKDPLDRLFLIQALGRTPRDKQSFEVVSSTLRDADNGVAGEAIRTLGRWGDGTAARAIESSLGSTKLSVAQQSAVELARLKARRSAPAIAQRLIDVELREAVTDPARRTPLEEMARALVALDYDRALPALRSAIARQTDPLLVEVLAPAAADLELIRQNRRSLSRWLALVSSPDRLVRELAYSQAGEIGGEQAVRGIVLGFDTADARDRLAMLNALGDASTPTARALIERVLLDPEFDPFPARPLRGAAAWLARRTGGPDMYSLLERAARRRNGRDPAVLVYAALVGGERALPLLADVRVPRMRYLGWERGAEGDELTRIAHRVAAGYGLTVWDVPPERLRVGGR